MRLRLQFPPDPDHARKLADTVVEATKRIDGIALDYLPESLNAVDTIICRMRERGSQSEQMQETLFSFGCYVGEVLVASFGGSWLLPAQSSIPKKMLPYFPFMIVQTPRGMVWNPIGKVFKLFDEGMGESTEYLFHVAKGREETE